jgi:hypothetical protein
VSEQVDRRLAILPGATSAVQDTRWTAHIAYARIGAMKTAAYIGKLASAGVDPKLAQAYGEAIEALLADEVVTKSFFEAKLQALKADLSKWMVGQTFAVAALVFAIARLVK